MTAVTATDTIEIIPDQTGEITEKVISIDRISRTVKGGRRIRFRALVAIGDRAGRVGVGLAKAGDVQTAIAKAKDQAQKILITVPLVDGTISHAVTHTYGRAQIILKPAKPGHSIIAGGSIRPVLELAGVKNIVSKSLGSTNSLNNAMATYEALKSLVPAVAKS